MSYPLVVARAIFPLGGIISNSFIIAVMIKEWAKCRRIASNEQLLLCLGVSNVFSSFLETIFHLPFLWTRIFWPLFLRSQLYCLSFIVVVCRFWFTVWLCIFYCIKIMNSTHPLFIQCKLRVLWLVPRLIVGSLAFSIFISIFVFKKSFLQTQMDITVNATNDTKEKTYGFIGSFGFIFLAAGSACPLLLVLLCSTLVVALLCKHIWQMRGEESGCKSFQIEGHMKAARTVLSLLFIYASFYVAHTLTLLGFWTENECIILTTMLTIYSAAQASILLMINPKLKKAGAQILRRTRSWPLRAK